MYIPNKYSELLLKKFNRCVHTVVLTYLIRTLCGPFPKNVYIKDKNVEALGFISHFLQIF